MNHRLLPSGRVSFHPLCNHLGDGVFESLLSGARTRVNVRRKIVDATLYSPPVPATHAPRFEIGAGVRIVPPNALPNLWHTAHGANAAPLPRRFVVIGAGKTAMDVCVWLTQSGADPEAIRWIVPRDSWVVNRVTTQNGPEFFNEAIGGQADQMQAFADASSVEDLFLRLEACGAMRRIDTTRMPTMFHFATLAPDEVTLLRGIRNVIRMGRVQALSAKEIVMAQGRVPVDADTLFIDCTASAVDVRAAQPTFQGKLIVPQMLRAPLISFSAALTAYIEAHHDDEALKNRLCAPVPFPHSLADYPHTMMANMLNQFQWSQDKSLREWMRASRLDGFAKLMSGVDKNDAPGQAVLARYKEQAMRAMGNLPRLTTAGTAS
jgi:hypothetical protein